MRDCSSAGFINARIYTLVPRWETEANLMWLK